MSNLTTRKIVLGTLMVLVLAFSVQGIAEAQTVSVSGDGSTTSASSGTTVITDYRDTPNVNVERSFTIRVSSAKNNETVTIAPTGARLTEVEVTSAPSPQTAFDDGDNPDSDTPTGNDAQISPAKGDTGSQTITFNGLGKPDSRTATGSWTIRAV